MSERRRSGIPKTNLLGNENIIGKPSNGDTIVFDSSKGAFVYEQKSFLFAELASNQTIVSIGAPIKFETVNLSRGSNITLDELLFHFNLNAGKTYKCMASVQSFVTGDEIIYTWTDLTNATDFGQRANAITSSASIPASTQPVAVGYITPSVNIEIFLKILIKIGTPQIVQNSTWASIEEI